LENGLWKLVQITVFEYFFNRSN